MKPILLAAMPDETDAAGRLASALKTSAAEIAVRHFPDGESLVSIPAAAETALIYCSLNNPNSKLVELGLAASAFRRAGAKRLVLIAPYLCYMRQDKAFHAGEAIAQRFVGGLLAQWFDRVITLEPHLHRVQSLSEIMPGIETDALSAAPLLAEMIRRDGDGPNTLLVGPDAESATWTAAVANAAGAPYIVLEKKRKGDRDVDMSLREDIDLAGRTAILIDDIVSTGGTLAAAARLLKSRGAASVEALAVHALFDDAAGEKLKMAGVARLRATDSVAHKSSAIHAAPLLALALNKEFHR